MSQPLPSPIRDGNATSVIVRIHNPEDPRDPGVTTAWVDRQDAHRVRGLFWRLDERGFARATNPGSTTSLRLHRVVLGLQPGDRRTVRHINGNQLDCRRANLTLDWPYNARNVTGRGKYSRHRGVSYDRHQGNWRARIAVGGQARNLGVYATEEEAARAAQAAYRELSPGLEIPGAVEPGTPQTLGMARSERNRARARAFRELLAAGLSSSQIGARQDPPMTGAGVRYILSTYPETETA